MIQRQHRQRSIFEATIGSIEQLVDGLIEPALQRLDEVLADPQLLEAVLGRLAQRRPHSRTRGRPVRRSSRRRIVRNNRNEANAPFSGPVAT